ncbi:MAG: CpaE family protein [Gemmatimonadota bacterium]
MEGITIKSALISTDREFRSGLKRVLGSEESGISVDLEITVPFPDINDAHLEQLRQLDPELIFLDLEEDPVMGLKFAQFLVEAAPSRRLMGVGPVLSPDLLIAAMQAGISEYLPKPITTETLRDAIDRLGRKFGRKQDEGQREPGKLYAVFSPKGGAGSTSVATNLAIEIHRLTRRKTLLVDLDLELGETALLLGVEPRFSFVDLVRNFHRVDAGLLASYIERHESGVELLSAPYHPAKAELVTGDQIRQILHFLKQHYDYIVVDTTKSFSPPTLATFEHADHVFLVTTVDLPSLRNITRCLPLLERMGSVKGEEWLRLIVNRYQPNDAISLKEVEKTLGMAAYWTLSNDYESVMRSINSGRPAVLSEQSSYARDLKALGAAVTGVRAKPEKVRKGLFGGLRNPMRRLIEPFVRRQEVTAYD